MGSQLPDIGVRAVVENYAPFTKAIGDVNDKIMGASKQAGEAAKQMNPFGKALDKAGISVGGFRFQLEDLLKQAGPVGEAISGVVDQISAIPIPAALAVAGIVALVGAFIKLGERGATLIGIGQSFDRLTASVKLSSQALLVDLRKASAGTISDFDLIRGANQALVGQVGVFGEAFGKSLPKLLEIARASARATGQDVNYLYDSIVNGIKRGSPKILDNLGIIVNATDANAKYAKSIGVAADQLTEEQKKVAYLNATLEAGQTILAATGTIQETNAEKMARAQSTITNILDGFAVAVQPAFGIVLDSVQSVLNIFQQLATAVAPIFGGILSIIASVFSTIVGIVTSIVQPIVDAISSIAPYVALVFQFIGKVVAGVGKVIGDVVGGIVKFLSDVGKNFFGLDLKNLGPQLFNGAAAAFGSFANGIIAVANQLIFPAVIAIAKFIADFLIGFSPPKEGPLSMIDKGGANVMQSWLDGFSGVSLDPVNQVAKEVSDALGAIGSESLRTVNARLAQLDKALLPFQNRLDIVKANFEALSEPANQALSAIDRQTAALQDAVAAGDATAAEKLRLLDQQRDAIQSQLDLQQGMVDRAQIQLALARAQQAPERALLTIRQAALEALIKAQGKAAKPATGAGSAASGIGGGAASGAPAGSGGAAGGIPTASGMPSVLDMIGGQGAVDDAAQGLSDAFMGAVDQTGLQDFAQNSLDLGTQIDRIKSVDIGQKLQDKFKGLTDAFDPNNPDSFPAKIVGFVTTLTGGVEVPGSIASFFAALPDNLSSAISGLGTTVASYFDPANPDSFTGHINGFITTLTGSADVPGSLASFFMALPQNIADAASTLFDTVKTNVFDSVINFLIGSGAGTMSDVIAQFVQMFADLPKSIGDALQSIGLWLWNSIAVPIINVLNAGIGLVEQFVQNVAGFFAGLLGDIIGGFDNAQIAGTNLGGLVPQGVRDFQANLASVGQGFHIARISTAPPAFLSSVPGGATGGMFGPGLMQVGEKGPELMYNATKMGVLPNQLVQVLSDLSNVLAQPQALPVAGGNSYSTDNSISATFNGVGDTGGVMRRMAALRARR